MSDAEDASLASKAPQAEVEPVPGVDSAGIPLQANAASRRHRTQVVAMQYQGPLPPPQLMREYDSLVPHGAERIFIVFEKQVEHRHDLERTVVQGNNRRADRGFWAALALALLVIAGGFTLAFLGKSVAGLAAIVVALASLVAVFITGRAQQSDELAKKAEPAPRSPDSDTAD